MIIVFPSFSNWAKLALSSLYMWFFLHVHSRPMNEILKMQAQSLLLLFQSFEFQPEIPCNRDAFYCQDPTFSV